jgi:2'-5' RNA ligase
LDNINQKLNELYKNIAAHGTCTIQEGGKIDQFLAHPEQDSRMGVALVFRIPDFVKISILKKMRDLEQCAPELYYYPPTDFHVTVLDLQRAKSGLVCSSELTKRYTEAIRHAAKGICPFDVRFCGMVASDGAVLVKGYYEPGLEALRQNLRTILRESGLSLDERYETFSCHVTIVRFPHKIESPFAFSDEISNLSNCDFGKFTVDSLQLVYHNWYDSHKEILSEMFL